MTDKREMTDEKIAEIKNKIKSHATEFTIEEWTEGTLILIDELHADRAKLKAETKALKRAAEIITGTCCGDECPASSKDATWVCDVMQAKYYNDESCSMEEDQGQCWVCYLRGEQ